MIRLFLALLATLSFNVIGTAAEIPVIPPATVGMSAEKLAEMDGLIESAISEKKMPGCVVLIGRPAGIAWFKAYGNRRVEPSAEPMTLETVFDLASLTKPLATATGIMKLVEQGRLTVDDPVSKHIPEFAVEDKQPLTIRDLLVHRSGLIPDNPISDYLDGPEKAKQRLFELKLTAPIRSRFMYSDVNFMVLGEVVARVSGQPLNSFVAEQIFKPLGMMETTYLPPGALRSRTAPTEERDEKWIQGEVHDPRAHRLGGVAGHAGLFSTARDLAIFASDAISGLKSDKSRILKQSTWQAMTEPTVIEGTERNGKSARDVRGLGWDMRSRYSANRGTKFSEAAFGHGGFTGTAIWIDPDKQLYVIFLSNRVHPNGKGLVNPLAGKIGEIACEALMD